MDYKTIDVCTVTLVRDRTVDYLGRVADSDDVKNLAKQLGYETFAEEVVGVFCLDMKGKINSYFEVSRGGVENSMMSAREIFKRAITANASSVILVHNHPSGEPTPSADDTSVTRTMVKAGEILGIRVLDHIIIGDGETYSYGNEGLISEYRYEA